MNTELDFEKRYQFVREVIETIVLTILMFLVIRFAVQNYFVDGYSMEPNLHNNERILVDQWTYLFHPPARGDVIVFVAPPEPSKDYVKRIIGIPGDIITINNTTVIVNGVTLQEYYIDPKRQGNQYAFKQINNMVVPPNDYFVLGDNRAGSYDSRAWGCVPRGNILGRAAIVYWPFGQDNDGLIPNGTSAFATVHQTGATGDSMCPVLTGPTSQSHLSVLNMDGMVLVATSGMIIFLRRRGKHESL